MAKNRPNFQKWIRKNLKDCKMTQSELSDLTGIHKNLISRYCRGKNYANIPHFYFLCVVFSKKRGMPVEDIIIAGIKSIVGGSQWTT